MEARAPAYRPRRLAVWLAPGIGFVAGFVNGFLGLGGGNVLVPAMAFALRVPQHLAHGTSISVILPTSAMSVMIYARHGTIDLPLVAKVAAGGVVGAYLGARLLRRIPPTWLRRVLGAFLILAALRMLRG